MRTSFFGVTLTNFFDITHFGVSLAFSETISLFIDLYSYVETIFLARLMIGLGDKLFLFSFVIVGPTELSA